MPTRAQVIAVVRRVSKLPPTRTWHIVSKLPPSFDELCIWCGNKYTVVNMYAVDNRFFARVKMNVAGLYSGKDSIYTFECDFVVETTPPTSVCLPHNSRPYKLAITTSIPPRTCSCRDICLCGEYDDMHVNYNGCVTILHSTGDVIRSDTRRLSLIRRMCMKYSLDGAEFPDAFHDDTDWIRVRKHAQRKPTDKLIEYQWYFANTLYRLLGECDC
jgi:hypothetical protein